MYIVLVLLFLLCFAGEMIARGYYDMLCNFGVSLIPPFSPPLCLFLSLSSLIHLFFFFLPPPSIPHSHRSLKEET